MIKGAIFDVDGTILNSMGIWNDVGAIYLRKKNKIPKEGLGEILYSMSLTEGAKYMIDNYYLDNSVEEIIEGVLSIINGFYLHKVQTKNGVVNLLKFLRKNNIKMIVATSSDYNQIDKAFKRLKIRNFFTDILTCETVGKSKSYPDIYLKCAEILGTTPEETLVFEDALFAIKTAEKANFKVVGVYDPAEMKNKNSIQSLVKYYIQDFSKVADWGHHLLSL